MEDLSRELEQEINAYEKRNVLRKKPKWKLFFIDDFGRIKSAGWVRLFLRLLIVLSLMSTGVGGVLGFLYADLNKDNTRIRKEVADLEVRIGTLANEKERLMAYLLISGKDPIEALSRYSGTSSEPERMAEQGRGEEGRFENGTETQQEHMMDRPSDNKNSEPSVSSESTSTGEPGNLVMKNIEIEKFRFLRRRDKSGFEAKFEIHNRFPESGVFSGRVFLMLQSPGAGADSEVLVVPAVPLENGIPSPYTKGQYFSIANYKPVKLFVSTAHEPDHYNKIILFVFDEEGGLVLDKIIERSDKQAGENS